MDNLKCFLVVFIFSFIHGTLGKESRVTKNTTENTMIETIIHNCTLDTFFNATELDIFRNQTQFSKCKNWSAKSFINNQSNSYEAEEINYVRCVLYFETFVSFCKHLSPTTLRNYSMILEETIPDTDVKVICKGLSSKPKIEENNPLIWRVTQNKNICEHICTEIKGEDIVLNSLCAKSYYYNNVTLSINKNAFGKLNNSDKRNLELNSNKNNPLSTNIANSYPKLSHANKTAIEVEGPSEDNYTEIDMDITPQVKNTESTNSVATESNKSANLLDELSSKTKENSFATNNDELYNKNIIPKQEHITLPRVVEEKTKQEETISNTFEATKNDQFSETYNYDGDMEGNSYFFTYFTLICVAFIVGYVGYHNKQKILALFLEGRQTRRSQRDMRPNSANYHKLDSTLEEAISSSCNKNSSYIIY